MIQYFILAILLGILSGILFHRNLFKKQEKRIISNISEKIMKQDYTYVVDGNRINLKEDVKKGSSSLGIPVYTPKKLKLNLKNIKPKIIKPKIIKSVKKKVKKVAFIGKEPGKRKKNRKV